MNSIDATNKFKLINVKGEPVELKNPFIVIEIDSSEIKDKLLELNDTLLKNAELKYALEDIVFKDENLELELEIDNKIIFNYTDINFSSVSKLAKIISSINSEIYKESNIGYATSIYFRGKIGKLFYDNLSDLYISVLKRLKIFIEDNYENDEILLIRDKTKRSLSKNKKNTVSAHNVSSSILDAIKEKNKLKNKEKNYNRIIKLIKLVRL